MNTKNIYNGLYVSNYKKMCELLGEEIKGGNAKKNQIEEWNRYFSCERKGQKFIVLEVYENPISKKESNKKYKYIKNGVHRYMDNFFEDKDKYGVYKIVYENHIYIGSTIRSFKDRLHSHLANSNKNCNVTQDMFLNHNAKLYIIKDMTGDGEILIRNLEKYYINQYAQNKNWICENKSKDTYVGNSYYIDKYGKTKKEMTRIKNKNIIKNKYKTIRISVNDFKKTIDVLKDNNINYK